MEAAIIAQGDELTTGRVADTNSAWIAGRLWDLGIEVRRVFTVPDRLDDLAAVVREAVGLAPLVLGTGGLGPTRDDLTAEAVARAFGLPLREDPAALAAIEATFARWGRPMPPSNRKQARLPEGAAMLPNPLGTAPGFRLERAGRLLAFLPGVPGEMRAMFAASVEPELRVRLRIEAPALHVLRVSGLGESALESRLAGLEVAGLGPADWAIGFHTRLTENLVKLRFRPGLPEPLRRAAVEAVRARIGPRAFCVDGGDLAEETGRRLAERGETLALAESCTAGRLCAWVGGVPGASRYLLEGAVVYSNAAKVRTAGVPAELIAAHGAVSEPVARALAEGIRARAGATWGAGITGIAGPGGGTPAKPVGTVHIAVAGPGGTEHHELHLPGDRARVTALAAAETLYRLFRRLEPAPR